MFLRHVIEFHTKFGLKNGDTNSTVCKNLTEDEIRFRLGFLFEELFETVDACGLDLNPQVKNSLIESINSAHINLNKYDELEIIDGLLDLIYVSFGTLLLKGLSEVQIREHQLEIQRANMSKERSLENDSRSKRNHSLDVVKPEGWKGPDHEKIMDENIEINFRNTSNEK